jgi:hypothetical protein
VIVAVVVLSVALGVTAAWCVSTATGVLRRRSRRVVVVTCKTGESFRGVLGDHDRRCLVLRQASVLSGDTPVPADGEIVILAADVGFLQFP